MRSKLKYICDNYNGKLKVVHINAQSLNNSVHYDEFVDAFCDSEIDVIAVSETFFHNNSKTDLRNYTVFNVNRQERSGGGVALYVSNQLNGKLLCKSNGESYKPEYLIVEVSFGKEKILVSCLYRPPKIGYLDHFLDDIYNVLPNYDYSIICGDLNARFGSKSYETKLVTELFELCNHTCISFEPTFHTENCHSTLDVIASNLNDKVILSGQCAAPAFSNHDMIYAVLDLSVPIAKKKQIKYRDFKNIDINALLEDVRNTPWNEVYNCDGIDSKIATFNEYILLLLNRHAPIKSFSAKNHGSPWMNADIRKMIDLRDRARQKSIKSKTAVDFATYKSLRNKAKQQIRNAKIKYYHSIFNNYPSPNKLWSNIRSLGIGKSMPTDVNSLPVSANDLNEHYLSVSSIENCDLADETEKLYSTNEYDLDNVFHFKFVTAHDIYKIITDIKSNAVGIDGVSIKFLKLILKEIVYILEHIFNYCLQSGVFPSTWKCANILPVPKVSNPCKCADFRPVSILCVLAKALEKIVHDQLYDYASHNNLFNSMQSGFRKGHSTVTALVKVADDVRKAIDERKVTVLVLLDFSKAFDRVNHRLLLIKLRKLDIHETVKLVNEDLNNLVKYVTSHNLHLNVTKTQPVLLGSSQYVNKLKEINVSEIVIDGTCVPYCDEVNNLGVMFDSTLSWRQHSNNVVKKVFSSLAQARRNFDCLPRTIRLRIVQSLIFPILDYGSAIFTDMNKTVTAKLQKSENACIRFVTGASRFEHITPSYVSLEIQKFSDRRTVAIASLAWKVLKYDQPVYLREMFKYSARHCHNLVIPVHRTEKYSNSFCVTTCRLFNEYSIYEYLQLSSDRQLKQNLKQSLKSVYS
ncbi:RNA-directed DNA polymerase from mobile element jockey [Frankliniella fusca]|uniref:RNA-directed DNA polymerase from mobile element jockey n=1 Tax=Frankliniella fusca TaxID=407009 RepID=A0AAE1LJN4_9NEOP|nr:RNA-directed DNA polymerase from mobile element jockey [Frankliniella fusca]